MQQRSCVRLEAGVARSLVLLLVAALGAVASPARPQGDLIVTDIAPQTRFQDLFLGHFNRGRALVGADFNLDGRVDFYVGNPGDESFVLENRLGQNDRTSFRLTQVLLTNELAWGGAAADYDNDGDYDLFVTSGGNEGVSFNHLFKNMFLEEGTLRFEEVTEAAGVKGPIPPGETEPIAVRNAGAVWGDYDRDGDVDIFVSVNLPDNQGGRDVRRGGADRHISNDCGAEPAVSSLAPLASPEAGGAGRLRAGGDETEEGRNILWRNDGDGTFTDVTEEVGLGVTHRPTRHSTFFDVDNDGDLDLYENNNQDLNVLWRNLLVETGSAVFEDATAELSPPGEDLQYPYGSFVSCSADFNNDGWEDLIVFQRGLGDLGPYPEGHALFLNDGGTALVHSSVAAELNNPFEGVNGVMGAQVGDLNADGVPDVYVGNGGPDAGQNDQLFLSDSVPGATPHYANRTDLIDFPAPERPGVEYPPYPYRTHATAFLDVDNDGHPEIAVNNGGPASKPDTVREPNRLFQFKFSTPTNYLKVRPVGDGVTVSRDAVGTRLALRLSQGGGAPWILYRTLFAGSCFSAQNGFEVPFSLGPADTIEELRVTWPDGRVDVITEGLVANTSIVVERRALPGQ